MPDALYYPYSRWLDDVALKRAVLVYDHLWFVDPVDQATRAELYLREGPQAAADAGLPQRWLDAAESYRLLENAGIVKTLARPRLDPQLLDALVNLGLHTDLQVNRLQPLFSGRRRWQMLEDRLPTSAFDYFRARGHRRDFSGRDCRRPARGRGVGDDDDGPYRRARGGHGADHRRACS